MPQWGDSLLDIRVHDLPHRDARFKMERTKLEAENVERDLRNMARELLLPEEKNLEKVARYEAHLSRGLYKALHELEALQVRRTGGAAPWRAWTWTGWQRAKGRAFIPLHGRSVLGTSPRDCPKRGTSDTLSVDLGSVGRPK
jgi:hypothetical protein